MNHRRGEGVACADGVGDFDSEAIVLVLGRRGDEQAAVRPARYADQLKSEFLAKPARRSYVAALGILERALNQFEETWKLFVIEFEYFGEMCGIAQNFAGEKGLAQIDVKDCDGERRQRGEEYAVGGAGYGVTLRQGTEADGVRCAGERNPVFGEFHEVPGNIGGEDVLGLSLDVELDFHGAGRVLRVALDVVDVEAVGFEVPERLLPQVIVADAAGDHGAIAQQSSDVGEVCGSAAKLLAAREKIPEKFAEADDDGARRGHEEKVISEKILQPKGKCAAIGRLAARQTPRTAKGGCAREEMARSGRIVTAENFRAIAVARRASVRAERLRHGLDRDRPGQAGGAECCCSGPSRRRAATRGRPAASPLS